MNQKTVLLGVLGVSLLVVAQNLTPLMSVVFLGGQLPSLPLGIWLFIAFTLGLISSRLITIILQSSTSVREYREYIDELEPPSTRKANVTSNPVTERSRSEPSRSERTPRKNIFSKSQDSVDSSVDSEDDWEAEPPKPPQEWEEEPSNPVTWGHGEQESQNTYRSSPNPPERPTEKPKDTVYDADYRVIIPPYGSSPPSPSPPPAPKQEQDTTDWERSDSNPLEDEDWV
ncbi:hypothetical protein PJF56_10425 [Roseofilum sp. BLCC_M91]|uniref:LapA family protein n=1 Tax=Roseofilum halophilum BLCC-M91 TaxID=3022259 RepID=A0ABT7BJC1_9CYAN|nr:hypothetical protein [Roseofilum halophilum]MDJ1179280.1 hypothetical protein [Roseofilum halophilum BLCC-M91]